MYGVVEEDLEMIEQGKLIGCRGEVEGGLGTVGSRGMIGNKERGSRRIARNEVG